MSPITNVLLFLIAPFVTVLGAPAVDANTVKQNGISAQQLNAVFATLKKTDSCQGSDMACVEGAFAQCLSGKWQTTACPGGTQCFALPLVNKMGTSITCDTQSDAMARISNTGVLGGVTGSGSQNASFAAADSNNSTDSVSNSNLTTSSLGTSNNSNASAGSSDLGANGSVNASSTSVASDASSSDCGGTEETVTITVTASSFQATSTEIATRSATLAPGFTLRSPNSSATATAATLSNVTATSSFLSSPTATPRPVSLNGTSSASTATTGFNNTTLTLSPSSASAFLSSLSAANPGITISTVSQSSTAYAVASAPSVTETNAATPSYGSSASSAAITLSLFTTSLASATASLSQATLIASPSTSSTAGGYGGYGY